MAFRACLNLDGQRDTRAPEPHERVFEPSGHGLILKPVAAKGTFRGPQGRRLASNVRNIARLCGPGWMIDQLEEGTFSVRLPTERRSVGTVNTFSSRLWFRPR